MAQTLYESFHMRPEPSGATGAKRNCRQGMRRAGDISPGSGLELTLVPVKLAATGWPYSTKEEVVEVLAILCVRKGKRRCRHGYQQYRHNHKQKKCAPHKRYLRFFRGSRLHHWLSSPQVPFIQDEVLSLYHAC